ncbi:hypothetical protein OJ997_11155 [Solirubrobacter phytolaccae]|uniref:Uncharacterized protein n=1 Tax=Solirubrobacter phytolaccae TaxID=1404360 RepID=A0A9X3NGQ5_9ACTN|nr:hypothetical protein [Solirubrobacter phytolaccae]MDA0180852.1 hypothetical protein [Solirubrobacter phytolaccae]
MPRLRHLPVLVALALSATSCGASEPQHIQAALTAWDLAWETNDYAAACALMTKARQRQDMGSRAHPRDATCTEALTAVYEPLEDDPYFDSTSPAEDPYATSPIRTTGIRVTGDAAVVAYSDGYRERMAKVDGHWLLDAQR